MSRRLILGQGLVGVLGLEPVDWLVICARLRVLQVRRTLHHARTRLSRYEARSLAKVTSTSTYLGNKGVHCFLFDLWYNSLRLCLVGARAWVFR